MTYFSNLYIFFYSAITASLLIFLLTSLAFFLSKIRIEYDTRNSYECGFKSIQANNLTIEVQFYRVAMLFLLFDIEILLLLPWAIVSSSISYLGHFAVICVLGLLLIG